MPKYSPEQTERIKASILRDIEKGLSVMASCKVAQIHPCTLYNWKKSDASFSEAYENARAARMKMLISQIDKSEAWQSKAWMLERQFPKEFGRYRLSVTPSIRDKYMEELKQSQNTSDALRVYLKALDNGHLSMEDFNVRMKALSVENALLTADIIKMVDELKQQVKPATKYQIHKEYTDGNNQTT